MYNDTRSRVEIPESDDDLGGKSDTDRAPGCRLVDLEQSFGRQGCRGQNETPSTDDSNSLRQLYW